MQEKAITVYKISVDDKKSEFILNKSVEESIDYSKILNIIPDSAEWNLFNVYRDENSRDVVYILLESKIIGIRYDNEQLYLVMELDFSARADVSTLQIFINDPQILIAVYND